MNIASLWEEVRVENVTRHIEWLTKNTPNRISSGSDVTRAADYIVDCLRSYGAEVDNEMYYTYNSTPGPSWLEVLSPVQSGPIRSLPCCHIRSTPSSGEVLDLIYLETADYADLASSDVKGKMVLAEMSYAPPVPEKARLLHLAGAAGMICMNWGNDEDVICNRALKAIWGNPTEETFPKIPDIIGLGVTRASGVMLRTLCAKGPVKVRAAATADRVWQQVCQPFGVIRGNGRHDEFILVSSHLDAWEPGVTCNATGNGMTLELCRVLALHRDELDRDIWVTFWNGHEIAEAAGSTWFLDNHWDEINRRCVCYMHIDSPGLREATLYEIKASDELLEFATETVQRSADIPLRTMELKKIGDQSFMGIGVPSVTQRMSYTPGYMCANNGATLGWWNHTAEDGLDKYDPANMERELRITLPFLWNLANTEYLPYEFDEKFRRLDGVLADLSAKYGAHFDLSPLRKSLALAACAVSRTLAVRTQPAVDERVKAINHFQITVARLLTNVFQTYCERYQQDSYGYGKLSSPIPLLSDLARLEGMAPESFEYGLLMTQLIKNRNRISDALTTVFDIASLYEPLCVGKGVI